MYEFEKEAEKKESEEAKGAPSNLFQNTSSEAPGSPTSFSPQLYQLILKIFQSRDGDLIKAMGE